MRRFIKPSAQLLGLIGVVLFALWLAQFAQSSEVIQTFVGEYGYIAVFVLSLVSGFNIIVPIPAPTFVPFFLESGLNAVIVVSVMTVGLTVADFLGFAIGKVGRELTTSWNRADILERLETLRERNFWLPIIALFVFASFAPLPNELLVIPLAFIGYELRYLILPILFGHVIFISWVSFGTSQLVMIF